MPRKSQFKLLGTDGGWRIIQTPKGVRYSKGGRMARLSPRAFGGDGWPIKIWK